MTGVPHLTSSGTLRASAPTQTQVENEQLAKIVQAEDATLYVVRQASMMKDDEHFLWLVETLQALGLDRLNRMHPKFERQQQRNNRAAMRIRARAKLSQEQRELLGQPISGYGRA